MVIVLTHVKFPKAQKVRQWIQDKHVPGAKNAPTTAAVYDRPVTFLLLSGFLFGLLLQTSHGQCHHDQTFQSSHSLPMSYMPNVDLANRHDGRRVTTVTTSFIYMEASQKCGKPFKLGDYLWGNHHYLRKTPHVCRTK